MIFNVLLPLPFNHGFDYRARAGMALARGDYVRVPFGRKSVWGVVWGAAEGGFDEKKIKEIEATAAHLPPMSEVMRGLVEWVSWYTLAPLGLVLKMALPLPEALEVARAEVRYKVSDQWPVACGKSEENSGHRPQATGHSYKLTPARLRILAYLSDGAARTAKEITLHAKVSAHVVREFVRVGGLSPSPIGGGLGGGDVRAVSVDAPHLTSPLLGERYAGDAPVLSHAQTEAAATLCSKLAAGFSVSMLDGVTGSGKTEVYFAMIAEALKNGKQVLVLLPEIVLSVQWLSRFRKRFGFEPEVWHSHVTPARKRKLWQEVALGNARVLVGARSALFLPFRALGAIIVDEEHDASYKQEEGVIYHARDMAVVRGSREKIPVALVSATPSLETEHNIELGRYARLHLPHRHADAQMPDVRLIDMRQEKLPAGSWISPALREALVATLDAGHQSLLFMNRRGYAPLMLCRACGHRFQCPHCSTWLVLHQKRQRLMCHHCAHSAPVPQACPECKNENCLIPYGPGVERVAEEVRALFPNARVEVMASDVIDTPAKGQEIVGAMEKGEIDILVGTQMIAKGHHFAGLALVGVFDADMGLGGGDLRTGERTYQLLHQLSGRAGREKIAGQVLLQTYLPDHPVMQALAAGERNSFMHLEADLRRDAGMPPYGKLASIIVEGKHEKEVADYARALVRAQGLEGKERPLILGPAPAPLMLLRGRYRYRILVKAEKTFALQPWLEQWLSKVKAPSALKVKIDVDPYSFF